MRSRASATGPDRAPWEADRHLDYFTPATNLITTRRLTDTTEIDVVFLGPSRWSRRSSGSGTN